MSKEMVNTEIPNNYAVSPSTLNGTPHLTINREAAFALDSSNAFEGATRLYATSSIGADIPSQGLRSC